MKIHFWERQKAKCVRAWPIFGQKKTKSTSEILGKKNKQFRGAPRRAAVGPGDPGPGGAIGALPDHPQRADRRMTSVAQGKLPQTTTIFI